MSGESVNYESVTNIIRKFKNYASIIKREENHQGHFSFSPTEMKDIYWELGSLDSFKAIQ